jgi:hypothetical protein
MWSKSRNKNFGIRKNADLLAPATQRWHNAGGKKYIKITDYQKALEFKP